MRGSPTGPGRSGTRFLKLFLGFGVNPLVSVTGGTYVRIMSWFHSTADEIDRGFDHFGGLRAASDAELCELIQAADVSQTWMRDGARNLVDWVALRLRVRHSTARRLVDVSKRLVDLPVLSLRFSRGDLSFDQVDALSKMATPDTEAGLVDEALGLSNAALDRMARRANPPSQADESKANELRALWIQRRLDEAGGRMTAELPNAELEIVESAIRERADRMPVNPETGAFDPYPQRMADGLVELCATTGDEMSAPPQITVTADLEALTTETKGVVELSSGNLIPNETARRLCCDAVVETIISDGSRIIGVGRNSRTVPGWLRRLVYHRDNNQCRFAGCGNTRWLQVHHIQHWSQGGKTDLDNLILLCGYHHRFVHEHSWHITTDIHGRFEFRRSDWTLHPPPRPDLDPRIRTLVSAGRPP